MRTVAVAAAGGISLVACVGAGCTQAAEIRMLVSNAVKTSLEVLAPEFERAAEHKLVITFGAASELKTEIDKGAAFDVAILTPAAIDALTKDGKAAAGRADIARAPFGLAIRKGASKPDIGTVDGFRRELLKANSIAYVEAELARPISRASSIGSGSATKSGPSSSRNRPAIRRPKRWRTERPSSASRRSAKSCPMRAPKWPARCRRRFSSIPSRPGRSRPTARSARRHVR